MCSHSIPQGPSTTICGVSCRTLSQSQQWLSLERPAMSRNEKASAHEHLTKNSIFVRARGAHKTSWATSRSSPALQHQCNLRSQESGEEWVKVGWGAETSTWLFMTDCPPEVPVLDSFLHANRAGKHVTRVRISRAASSYEHGWHVLPKPDRTTDSDDKLTNSHQKLFLAPLNKRLQLVLCGTSVEQ